MTEVLRSPSSSSTPPHNAAFFQHTQSGEGISGLRDDGDEDENEAREKRENDRRDQLSVLAVFVTVVRKSFWLTCKTVRDSFPDDRAGGGGGRNCGGGVTEIGWPTDVQHVNHVTFDRFDGFLGLPDEFEPEVPRRAPSASATVFGVSTESMQLSYDHRGNSIPTILLLLQRHLYSQGGLRAEGIFRITAGNSQDEYVRDQLSRGVVPQGIDVHCLAGLIKAWFRELPRGVLDSLSPEQVMQCESEEDCDALVRLLPPSEVALLDWAINLMADVVQQEHLNKMNARNIAMVFAPNMTQMDDPLIALMYTVQVMNFLKTLTEKILRERQDSVLESTLAPQVEPFDDDGHQSISELHQENPDESKEETMQAFVVEDPGTDSGSEANQVGTMSDEDYLSSSSFTEESDESGSCGTPFEVYTVALPKPINILWNQFVVDSKRSSSSQSNESNPTKPESRTDDQPAAGLAMKIDNVSQGISNLCRINSMPERFEAWC